MALKKLTNWVRVCVSDAAMVSSWRARRRCASPKAMADSEATDIAFSHPLRRAAAALTWRAPANCVSSWPASTVRPSLTRFL
jgi:hypothetical protein